MSDVYEQDGVPFPEREQPEEKRLEPFIPTKGFFLAGFWIRFWAYIIDLIVIGSVTRLLVTPVFKLLDIPMGSSMFAPYTILTTIVFYAYFVLMTKFFHQTLGKMLFGVKVVGIKGQKLDWGTVLFRELIGRFITGTFFLLYAVVAFTTKKQGIHDLFADTTVVHEKRKMEFTPAQI